MMLMLMLMLDARCVAIYSFSRRCIAFRLRRFVVDGYAFAPLLSLIIDIMPRFRRHTLARYAATRYADCSCRSLPATLRDTICLMIRHYAVYALFERCCRATMPLRDAATFLPAPPTQARYCFA